MLELEATFVDLRDRLSMSKVKQVFHYCMHTVRPYGVYIRSLIHLVVGVSSHIYVPIRTQEIVMAVAAPILDKEKQSTRSPISYYCMMFKMFEYVPIPI